MIYPALLALVAFGPMLLEMQRSLRNEQALRRLGAVDPPGDVYPLMQVVYPACFVGLVIEASVRGRPSSIVLLTGVIVFVAAKALKYWAIATLGSRWTFRVLVPPGSQPTRRGPYRYLRHPNYVGVAGEIAGMALCANASVVGPIAFIAFVALMIARVRVEERAMGLRAG